MAANAIEKHDSTEIMCACCLPRTAPGPGPQPNRFYERVSYILRERAVMYHALQVTPPDWIVCHVPLLPSVVAICPLGEMSGLELCVQLTCGITLCHTLDPAFNCGFLSVAPTHKYFAFCQEHCHCYKSVTALREFMYIAQQG